MTGQIRSMLDKIIETRSQGNAMVAGSLKTRLALKGLNPDKFDRNTPDDPTVLARVREVALELGVAL